MHSRIYPAARTAVIAIASATAAPAIAAESSISGHFALPGASEKVTGEMGIRSTGPLTRELEFAFFDKATGAPILQFEAELAEKLHLLAIDSNFSHFVHEHPGEPGPDGRFRMTLRFPAPGLYHLYADAVLPGLGQQVVRFDLPVGVTADREVSGPTEADQREGRDGPYSVAIDSSSLRAGIESLMALTISKDGKPATDLGLYLGVPAHAVFVHMDDLSYVHAHAMTAEAAKAGHGIEGAHAPHGAHHGQEEAVPANLLLHAVPPCGGRYALWIQFRGGGEIRTVPFTVTVPAAP